MQEIRYIFIFFSLFPLKMHPYFVLAKSTTIEHLSSNARGNESDYKALLAIRAEISNDPNSVLSSWSNSLHFCRWRGVTCGHKHMRVVSLDLSSSFMVGTLSPFIGNLSFLRELDLSNNSFRGDIPHQISYLPRLRILALATNSFEGEIPSNLSRCSHLFFLDLSNNKLEGRIPTELTTLPNLEAFRLYRNHLSGRLEDIGIGNMSTSLQTLYLHDNIFQGSIPNDVGRLKGLFYLSLGENTLSGTIPISLFNLSSLKELHLSMTKLNGNLPQDLGLRLPQLQYLYLANTSLIGQVPTSLSNLSHLIMLDISYNSFMGDLFINGNNLPHLVHLGIIATFASREKARDLSFVDTLTNCSQLAHLLIGSNSYTGVFPQSILNLSLALTVLDVGDNQIFGQLPAGLGKFVNLYFLVLEYNFFTGPIPTDIGKLENIERIYFSHNNFSHEIPPSLGNLTLLSELSMQYNNLEGSLPKSFQNLENLRNILLRSNKLSGVLPAELFHYSGLINLDFSQNSLQGSLPAEIGSQKNLFSLDVSQNRFSGEIPNTLGACTSLTFLDISQNSFFGSIPELLSPLKSIQALNLSCNNLSGPIPSYLSSWPYLISLNLSFNNLEGEAPTQGVFANTSDVSVVGNKKLCGGLLELHLPRCPSPKESKRRRLPLALIVIIPIACVLGLVLSIAFCFYLLCSSKQSKDASSESELQNIRSFLEVSYQMLSRATNGFSPSNLIGVGGFGSVYKGILNQDDTELVVAVKVMDLRNHLAGKSFTAECKALSNIRHRNLLKIITACSSIDTQRNDFKALVYEYMPMGSLENWLHSNLLTSEQFCSLSLFQSLNIAIEVASALEYLHTGCGTPIIHCDLKPSNILLDSEMVAHVGDFGLSKFLLLGTSTSNSTDQTSSTQVRGTVGYAAPEYGLGSKVSPEGDVYSFGIIVLEMMTSKKPTDPMFNDGLNLHDLSNSALPDRVMEIVDQRMIGDANVLYPRTVGDIRKMECIKSLIMVGVQCSMSLPQERMSISKALNELKSAKQNMLT